MDNIIERETITELKQIKHPQGDVYHALKASEHSYAGFGEAYFTQIFEGETKGWKKHTQMTMNLIVPVGDVTFYIYDETNSKTRTYRINQSNYCRLTVPPGYWMAFKGHDPSMNLVLNVASIEHCPKEAENVALSNFFLGA